jgi:hypothetical protein
MMRLTRLEVENFGPYYDRQDLAFGEATPELVLVHGENMAGKTSLLNALRWGLYGIAKGRDGMQMPTQHLINNDAYDEGNFRASVMLQLTREREGKQEAVVLKRQVQAKKVAKAPTAEKDFETHLDVTVDGNILATDKYDDTVNELLPEGIARFFLFDGELLEEYEELVATETTFHAKQVKKAIEMILGVPAATNGIVDLKMLRAEVSRRYNAQARKHSALAKRAAQAEQMQKLAEDLEREMKALEDGLTSHQQRLAACDETVEKYQDLRDDAIRRSGIESEQKRLVAADERKRQERRDYAVEFWRDLLAPRLSHATDALERERTAISAALRTRSDLAKELALEKRAADHEQCVTCGQTIPDEKRLSAKTRILEIESTIAALPASMTQSRQDEIGAVMTTLRSIAPAGVASAIAQIEQDLDASAVTRHKLGRELGDINERLKDLDTDAVAQNERERANLVKVIGVSEQAIEKTDKTLAATRNTLRGYEKDMREQDDPALREMQAELEIYEGAETVFTEALAELVKDLRLQVESEASRIFRALTTDKTYRGLEINDNYGLTIIDRDGSPVEVRSAGAEQIVALSLIGALNQLAAKRGPVIMDTPFGRLDRGHRENILRFIPSLSDQVALLVHSGEIDPTRDLEPVKGLVSAEFRIERDGAATSVLKRM